VARGVGGTVLELTDEPTEADVAALVAGLMAFNEPHLGRSDFRRLGVLARRQGRLAGGLVGETGRGFLFVDLLWVAEEARKSGLGSRLLAAAEGEALRRGCHAAWLDTYDFQARPFYERHGYALRTTLGGLPNGHAWLVMAKDLPAAPTPTPG
jgi:GNAT superfamily N-acetyltransferase